MRTRLFAVPLASSLVVLGLVFAGCGPKNEPNTADLTNPCPPGQTCPQQQTPCPPGQLCPQPSATVTAPPPPTGTAPAPTASASGSAATPVPPLGAMAVTPILQAMGGSEAPGMKAEGQAFAANFQEGQTLEQPINIQAGKCYTIVAASIGITELDIQLVAQAAPLPPVVLAQDNQTGPNPTLGGKGQCFRNPSPLTVPGKVILKATKGTGMAGAQVFIK
jgi:hypothetical protein